MTDFSTLLYEVALSRVRGIRFSVIQHLMRCFGNAEDIFKASSARLLRVADVGPATVQAILSFHDFDAIVKECEILQQKQVRILFFTHPDYPRRLLQCADAPPLLYYKGNASLNHERMLAVVGSRKATDYGREWTRQLVSDLQGAGVIVVSGLATGIDAAAHQAALDNDLPTIGVMAHGFNRIYPPWHKPMAEKMISQGGLLTEYGLHEEFAPYNFPARNRIVAGLCDAIVVTETGIKGGAMITCHLAGSYHRDVFALPGRVQDPLAAGCHQLIKTHQAALVETATDLLQAMGWEQRNEPVRVVQQRLPLDLNDEQQAIYNLLAGGEMHIDELLLRSGQTPGQCSSVLLQMEMNGYIASLPGKRYQRRQT